jgi:hypothetical protein
MFTRLTILLFAFFTVAALVLEVAPDAAPPSGPTRTATTGVDPVAELIAGDDGGPAHPDPTGFRPVFQP